MGLFSLKKLLKRKRGWNGSPEMFLALILEMSAMNRKDHSEKETIQLGEVMLKLIKVDLSPYENFSDLLIRGIPDYSMIEVLREKMAKQQQRVDLKKAIYGEAADLGDDDVMRSDAEGAIFARKFIEDFIRYVDLKDEG